MIILLSSARTMKTDEDSNLSLPIYIDKTLDILDNLKALSKKDLQKVWKCSNKNLEPYIEELLNINLEENLTMAIKAYDGVVYKQFADLLQDKDILDYLEEHLRIISAFYGLLKPKDGIRTYRLEMACPFKIDGKNLYRFWNHQIYSECRSDFIINLASEEYGKCVREYINEYDNFIDIDFLQGNKRISTQMKKARGLMLRFMATNNIKDVESIKSFNLDGYCYNELLSNDKKLVFSK